MFELEKEQAEASYPPRWQIGIDRRQVIVYVCLALVGGFAFGFVTAKYTASKESVAALPQQARSESPSRAAASDTPPAGAQRVSRIIRGDTIEVDGVGPVRMIGIETLDGREVYGSHAEQALAFTEKTLLNQDVIIEYDQAFAASDNKDERGQTLAYVYTRDGALFNAELIKRGYAMVRSTESFRLIDEFRGYERDAMQAMRGVWGLDTSSPQTASTRTPISPGDDKQRKVNPMMPSDIGPNLPAVSGQSGLSSTSLSSEPTVVVSSADRMYHKSGCEYLGAKKQAIALSQARSGGYTACGRCYPSTTLKAP
jgi:micrococcal nuclease